MGNDNTMSEEATGPQEPMFNIEKLYVKDLSLEMPHAPAVFLEREAAQVEIQLNTQAEAVGEEVFEVTVTATVTSRLKDKTVFLIEVKQAGIFRIRNVPATELEPVLAVVCPNMLYPYLREVVSDISVRAGMSPVLLGPMNFEGLYHQQQQQAQPASEATH
jgi:preprotein translocase subunit SecB